MLYALRWAGFSLVDTLGICPNIGKGTTSHGTVALDMELDIPVCDEPTSFDEV